MVAAPTLDFFAGHAFQLLRQMVAWVGSEPLGLYEYYEARLKRRELLVEYEKTVISYICSTFDRNTAVIHAGIGLGLAACYLTLQGFRVLGVERDQPRAYAAPALRRLLAEEYLELRENYQVIAGEFPRDVPEAWRRDCSLLLFTDVGARWPQQMESEIFAALPRFSNVILDLGAFGGTRQGDSMEPERAALVRRIIALGSLAPIPIEAPGRYFRHFRFDPAFGAG